MIKCQKGVYWACLALFRYTTPEKVYIAELYSACTELVLDRWWHSQLLVVLDYNGYGLWHGVPAWKKHCTIHCWIVGRDLQIRLFIRFELAGTEHIRLDLKFSLQLCTNLYDYKKLKALVQLSCLLLSFCKLDCSSCTYIVEIFSQYISHTVCLIGKMKFII